MKTIAIVNRKGGVGKTITAIELAYILATMGRRVLVIDADSQCNATITLLPSALQGTGLAGALRQPPEEYRDLVQRTDIPFLDLIPATEALGDFELECTLGLAKPDFSLLRALVAALMEDDAYDNVVIDCPPYYSVSCISAVSACDSIVIPVGVDAYSTVGMASLVRQIDNIRRACPHVQVAGCLVTQWHRAPVSENAVDTLRDTSPVPIFRTHIRRTDKAPESSWAGMPVGQWSPFSSAARDYRAWVAELAERGVI